LLPFAGTPLAVCLARTVADVWYVDPTTLVQGSSIGASLRDAAPNDSPMLGARDPSA
jgi:hypothetical protein